MRSSWQATWLDLKQLGWALLLLWLVVAGLAFLTRRWFGPRTLTVGLGLAGAVTVVFVVLVTANLLLATLVARWRRGRGEDDDPM